MLESLEEKNYVKMLEAIIETSYDGIYITDGEANTIYANKSYERISGLKKEDLIGHNMSDLVRSGMISEATSFLVLKSKRPVTVHQVFNTGKNALVTSTPFIDNNNQIQMIVSNVRDVTDLKTMEEKIKISTNENIKYKNLIEELRLQIASSSDYIVAEDENMLDLLLLAKRVARVKKYYSQ